MKQTSEVQTITKNGKHARPGKGSVTREALDTKIKQETEMKNLKKQKHDLMPKRDMRTHTHTHAGLNVVNIGYRELVVTQVR